MDFSMLTSLIGDPSNLGMDGAISLSINGLAGKITEFMKEVRWHDRFSRFYFLSPFLAAFAVVALQHGLTGWGAVVSEALRYGIYATLLYHGHKKVVQGK